MGVTQCMTNTLAPPLLLTSIIGMCSTLLILVECSHLDSNKISSLSFMVSSDYFWQYFLAESLRNMKCRCQSTSTDEPKTKMNFFDNASNLLTNLLSGGKIGSMPIAEGAVSDLFDRPLFFSLYDWFLQVITLVWFSLGSPHSFELCCSVSSLSMPHPCGALQKYSNWRIRHALIDFLKSPSNTPFEQETRYCFVQFVVACWVGAELLSNQEKNLSFGKVVRK